MKLFRNISLTSILCSVLVYSSYPVFSQQLNSSQSISPYQKEKIRANKNTVTLVSGGIDGTYIRFARDMADVLNDKNLNGLRVLPILGMGGTQNIRDVLFLQGIDMGITQAEYLTYLKKDNPTLFRGIQNKVRYITKLYESELHIVARRDIKSLKDLKGKKVNLWRRHSSTDFTTSTVFKLLNIEIKPIYMDIQLALEQVKSGKIGATAILAGAPVNIISDRRTYENLHLVPINNPELYEVFLPSVLAQADYPNLIRHRLTIPTIASSTVLAVYNWPTDTLRYAKIDLFVKQLFSNIDQFKVRPWHKKWKYINLAAKIPGWKRFGAANNYLNKFLNQPNTNQGKKVSFKKFQEFISKVRGDIDPSTLTNEQEEKLYKSFLDWVKKNKKEY